MKTIDKICPVCSKIFTVNKCHSSRYTTCGYTCGGVFRRKKVIENSCEICNTIFISKKSPTKPQRFCSRFCSAQSKKNGQIFNCIECEKQFYSTPYRISENKSRGKFCSNECRLKNWNENSMKNQSANSYRRNAIKIYEMKCHDCGNEDERVIVIHHIDGNRKNGKISNLIPVCHNCHCIRHIEMGDKRIISALRRHH